MVAVVAVSRAVGARTAAVTVCVAAAVVMSLAVPSLLGGAKVVAMHPRRERRRGKEDGVHNGKGPDGLEHVAGAFGAPRQCVEVAAQQVCP